MSQEDILDVQILKEIAVNTPNGVLVVDEQGEIFFMNTAAEELLGCQKTAKQIMNIQEFIPDYLKHTQDKDSGKMFTFAANALQLHYRTFSVKDSKENPRSVVVLMDLQESIKMYTQLKSTKNTIKELEEILEGSWDGILVTDGDGNILYVNSSYERVAAIKRQDMKNKNMRDLMNPIWMENSVAFVVKEHKMTVSKSQVTKDGRNIIVTGTPVFDKNKNIKKIVINARDITEIYKLREELINAKEHELKYYENVLESNYNGEEIPSGAIAVSPVMQNVFTLASKVGKFDATVLILGESGAGKEEVAKHIHYNSLRKNKPFITINCGAIPDNLLESELFGYEKGAFTGASSSGKKGLLEAADTGTIFLDEIGELPLNFQVKILRVIENKEITRIGALKPQSIDVRFIAATNRDLSSMVAKGEFREDLFYRLNIVQITVPPLRERKEDILPLSIYFLKRFNKKYNQNKILTADVIKKMEGYLWPGNVRQLRNVVESMVVLSNNDYLQVSDLPWVDYGNKNINEEEIAVSMNSDNLDLDKAVAEFEKKLLLKAKEKFNSTREIGKYLNIDQSTVVRKMKKYGI